MTRSELKLN